FLRRGLKNVGVGTAMDQRALRARSAKPSRTADPPQYTAKGPPEHGPFIEGEVRVLQHFYVAFICGQGEVGQGRKGNLLERFTLEH
ncbi:hypothetical protein, partial [Candidatus Hakubella thermalkaliphila]|uniref:hypothetical protein n=1 Tax=Candidatus Hakubella thermalkaliphila TaxID=2754717 RepID=UPI001C6122F6